MLRQMQILKINYIYLASSTLDLIIVFFNMFHLSSWWYQDNYNSGIYILRCTLKTDFTYDKFIWPILESTEKC